MSKSIHMDTHIENSTDWVIGDFIHDSKRKPSVAKVGLMNKLKNFKSKIQGIKSKDNPNMLTGNVMDEEATFRIRQTLAELDHPKVADAKFDGFRRKTVVGKLPQRRLIHWEQLLEKVMTPTSEEKKYAPNKPIRKLSGQRMGAIHQVIAKNHGVKALEKAIELADKEQPKRKVKKQHKEPVTRSRVNTNVVDSLNAKMVYARLFKEDSSGDELDPTAEFDEALLQESTGSGRVSVVSNDVFYVLPPGHRTSRAISIDHIIKIEEQQTQAPESVYTDLTVLIDMALQNNPLIQEFLMAHHPFFHGMAINDPKRITVSNVLAEALSLNMYYTVINVSDCSLSDTFIEALCKYFVDGRLKQLKTLNLSLNQFTESGIISFARVLESVESLALEHVYLDHQSQSLTIACEKALAWGLRSNLDFKLITLELGTMQDEESRTLIKKCLERNRDIRLGKAEETFIPSELEEHIRSVFMNQKRINDDTAFILDGDLMFCALPSPGKLALATGIRLNTFLVNLTLTHVDLEDDFALALAESLVSNSSLKTLILNENKITTMGLSGLLFSLEMNKTLDYFACNHQIPPAEIDIEALELVISSNISIVKLDLDMSNVSDSLRQRVESWINGNCFRKVQNWGDEL